MTIRNNSEDRFDNVLASQLTRRSLIKRAALVGATTPVFGMLLAACEADDDEPVDDDAADEPDDENEPVDDAADESDDDDEPVDDDDDEPVDDDEPDDNMYGGTVSWWHGSGPRTLNPLFSTSNRETPLERLIMGWLAKVNGEFEAELDMAESLDATEDGTSYTFVMYEGIRFTDGEPVTTDDVRFTLERAVLPATGSVWRGEFVDLEGFDEFSDGETDTLEGIVTPDELTITFNLRQPNGVFLLNLVGNGGLGILPKHILEDVAPEELADHEFSTAPTVTAGAFKFVEWAQDQFVEFERNDDYFREDLPYLDRIIAISGDEISVGVAQMETGEIDILPELPYEEMERMESIEHITINSVESATLAKLILNVNRIEDQRVRQAMAYAIDNEGMLEAAVRNEGFVLHHPYVQAWVRDIDGLIEYSYDPDRARELLEEAEWDSDQPIVLTTTVQSRPWWNTNETLMQDMFREVGIQFEIDVVDGPELQRRRVFDADFDCLTLSGSTTDPALYPLASWEHPPDALNYSHFSDERVDELLAEGKAATDIDVRREIYAEVARIVNEACPEIYFYSPNNVSGVNNRVGGVTPPALRDNMVWNAEEWFIRED